MSIYTAIQGFLAIGAAVFAPMSANSQIVTRSTILPATPVVSPAALMTFRAGLQASALPLVNPSPSPLADAAVSWHAYPGASGYQLVRQVRLSATDPWSTYVAAAPTLPSTVASYTARGLAPGWLVQFRIVALVAGTARDTTNPVQIQTPAANLRTAFLPAIVLTPLNTTYQLANVIPRRCMTGVVPGTIQGAMILAWARNPAAGEYSVGVVQTTSATEPSLLPLIVVADTQATVGVPTYVGFARAYVRPDFLIPNWRGPGQTDTVAGQVTYFGSGNPGPSAPCREVQ